MSTPFGNKLMCYLEFFLDEMNHFTTRVASHDSTYLCLRNVMCLIGICFTYTMLQAMSSTVTVAVTHRSRMLSWWLDRCEVGAPPLQCRRNSSSQANILPAPDMCSLEHKHKTCSTRMRQSVKGDAEHKEKMTRTSTMILSINYKFTRWCLA